MRFAVLTARYALSGVPLAQERLAKALARRGHRVDFLIGMVNPGAEAPRPAGVTVHDLGEPRVRSLLGPLRTYLREARPDAVFSAGDHLNAVLLAAAVLARSKARLSCSSRVTPFDTYSRVPFSKGWLLKWAMRMVMWRADALTCVSQDMVAQYRRVFPRGRHTYAYNIVVDEDTLARAGEPVDDPWLGQAPLAVAAGALEPWKGFDDLLRAWALVRSRSAARLLILGEGPQRQGLERLRSELGLGDCVRLPGAVTNPLKHFRNADVFVLSSHVEGMPNVLVEAMACGCSPVATDCPTGPRELLADGQAGRLVPVGDAPALAEAILATLSEPVPPETLLRAVEPFTEAAVLRRQFALLGLPEAAA